MAIAGRMYGTGVSGGMELEIYTAQIYRDLASALGGEQDLGVPIASSGNGNDTAVTISNNGGYLRITYASAHGLSTGDIIVGHSVSGVGIRLAETIFSSTVIDTTTAWDAESFTDTTGFASSPMYLQIPAGRGGLYRYSYYLSPLSAVSGTTMTMKMFKNATAITDSETLCDISPTAYRSLGIPEGFVQLTGGDRIWLGIANHDDDGNIIVGSGSLSLCRI